MSLCAICHRQARGFGYNPALAKIYDAKPGKACSMKCLKILKERKGMIDPTPNELEALHYGGQMGGGYLEELGKTNLAALNSEEWQQFLLCILGGYTEKMAAYNDIPFKTKEQK